VLNVSHLRKQYSTVLAVDDVSLEVKRGQVVGLLGPNGAGKTTTIRMILNIIQADAGSILFDGKPFSEQIRNSIGYLPEERGLYRKNRLLNTILYFASLKGIGGTDARSRAYGWLKRFDLLNHHESRVDELSKGNQQKVQFIISILNNPELVILDEPFSGLDPINQNLLKDILQELKQQGKAIIFSTHQMDQAEKLCDSICLINRGRVVLDGGIAEVKDRYGKNTVQIEFDGDGSIMKHHVSVKSAHIYEHYAELVLDSRCRTPDFLRELTGTLDVRKFQTTEPSLNSIFLDVVGTSVTAGTPTPPVQVKPALPEASRDERVKKAFRGVLIGIAAIAVIFLVLLFKRTLSWDSAGLFAVILGLSLYKYWTVRNKVRAEIRRKSLGGNSHE
jgi:ABC-2 type transport system ATP-binding protein